MGDGGGFHGGDFGGSHSSGHSSSEPTPTPGPHGTPFGPPAGQPHGNGPPPQPGGDPYGGGYPPYGQPPPYSPPGWQQPSYAMAPYGAPGQFGPPGRIRSTGICVLLMIVTFGIYGIFWFGMTFAEMKRHAGQGLGGGWAVAIYLLTCGLGGLVLPFLSSAEVGRLYERRGMPAPVGAITGLWTFLPLVGSIVWWVKTHNALNDYWAGCGVQPA